MARCSARPERSEWPVDPSPAPWLSLDAVVLSCHPGANPAQTLSLSCGFELLTDEFHTAPDQLGYWLMSRRPTPRAD